MAGTELLTRPVHLSDAARDLRRQAARLGQVRTAMTRELAPAALAGKWEGKVAERFLVHVDGRHRLAHLDTAHDRLALLALACERAADANTARIALHRRLERETRDALAARGDLNGAGLLPTSLRDTSWPRWHRWATGAGAAGDQVVTT